jgi:two-component system, OmpR family, sensor kinase
VTADQPLAPGLASPRRWSLTAQTALATTAVALVAVVITGLVSLGLVRDATEEQARRTLGDQADLVAATLDRRQELTERAGRRVPPQLRTLLNAQEIGLEILAPEAAGSAGLDNSQVAAVAAGSPVSARVTVSGVDTFVEARPTEAGRVVVLTQPVTAARQLSAEGRRRLLSALVVGLVVAVIAGVMLSRLVARPLRRAAVAAHGMSMGARDVRLDPEGPREVAEVATALNALAAALTTSEGRQREFLLSVSHELRTPLTAISGYAEALSDGVVPPSDVERTGEIVREEARRLERLVSDLLDLARLNAKDFRIDLADVDLAELVRAAGQVWADRCRPHGIQLRVELPSTPLIAHTDATRVRQILDGLAENALRVTREGRPIVLAARADPDDARQAILEVRDGGPGLTADDIQVAFERSALYERYRGLRRVGTGLGLALVAGLAARLGGSAAAGTSPEGGASFTIRLPRESVTEPLGRPALDRPTSSSVRAVP